MKKVWDKIIWKFDGSIMVLNHYHVDLPTKSYNSHTLFLGSNAWNPYKFMFVENIKYIVKSICQAIEVEHMP